MRNDRSELPSAGLLKENEDEDERQLKIYEEKHWDTAGVRYDEWLEDALRLLA